jgi:hypothetical protein
MQEVAEHVSGCRVPRASHWFAEETPGAFTAALVEFVRMSGIRQTR